ncbi:hypothetical protein Ancab_020921 [Ancistrocladus abbreviatus]
MNQGDVCEKYIMGGGKGSSGGKAAKSGGGSSGAKNSSGSGCVQRGGDGNGMMKAPGRDEYISRQTFEKDPAAYFHALHHENK